MFRMEKHIFTFWEPKHLMPAYIKLCIETWKKFLPEYKIHIVDYSSLDSYLGENYFDEIFFRDFSLPMQADAIRCALLHKFGGLWLDADTIITSNEIKKYIEIPSDLVMIDTHLAFIKANAKSKIIHKWENKIKESLLFYSNQKYNPDCLKSKLDKFLHYKLYKKLNNWDYLGNALLHKYLKTKNKKEFFRLNKKNINALPEINCPSKNDFLQNYQTFYFENDYSQEVLNNTQGIILLHNSWTPEEYLKMDETTFLKQENTLSNILKSILQP